jgi:hypothetical protein
LVNCGTMMMTRATIMISTASTFTNTPLLPNQAPATPEPLHAEIVW